MSNAMKQAARRDEDKTFGERLLEAIAEKGGSTTRVGASKWLKEKYGIEVSSTQITKYKNADEKPRIDQCAQYAIALGVTVEWLYTGRGLKWPLERLSADEDKLIRLSRAGRELSLLSQLLWYAELKLTETQPPSETHPPAATDRNKSITKARARAVS